MSSKAKKIAKDMTKNAWKEKFKDLSDKTKRIKTDMMNTADFMSYFLIMVMMYRFASMKGCSPLDLPNYKDEFEAEKNKIMNDPQSFDDFIETITDEEIDFVKSMMIDK